MFDDFLPQFKEAVSLAKNYEDAYLEELKKGLHPISTHASVREDNPDEKLASSILNKELVKLLNSFDFEAVKILQVLMYLGRDRDYDRREVPETVYKEHRMLLNSGGWKSQEIEVNQMTSLIPFGTFLEQGFEILGIPILK